MSDAPAVQRIGDDIYVSWTNRYLFQFGHFLQAPWGLQAEVSLTVPERGVELAWGQIQLTSTESRGKLAKRLDPEAAALLDLACRAALRLYRQPPPWVEMQLRPAAAVPWFWTDWIPANQTTVLYADGDSGKSLLALTLCVCALTGLPFAGTWPIARARNVLYIDYESCLEDHEHRLALICRAMEVTQLPGLHYLPASQPIAELVPFLRGHRDRTHAELVVLDSASMASGHEPESARAALEWVSALRQLAPATRIALAHVSKAALATPAAPRQAYGSVQVRNGPRCSLDMRRQADAPGGLHVTLHVNKNNLLHNKPPDIGLILDATDQDMAWRRDTERRRSKLPIWDQIKDSLPTDPEEAIESRKVAERFGLDAESVAWTLRKAARNGEVRRTDAGVIGRGEKALWIRIVEKAESDRGFSTESRSPFEDDPGF